MKLELDKLKALAAAATPGPWAAGNYEVYQDNGPSDRLAKGVDWEDAQFIAAANPATINAMIELIERQERELAAARGATVSIPLIREGDRWPEGWKLVPVDPTDEMAQAGNDSRHENESPFWREIMADAYRAMLAAAPAAPVSASPQQAAPADDDFSKRLGFLILQVSNTSYRCGAHIIEDDDAGYSRLLDEAHDAEEALRKFVLAASHQAAAGAEGADGWRTNTGVQPVADHVPVDVQFRCGRAPIAGMVAGDFRWYFASQQRDSDPEWDIVKWRPAPPSTSQPAREGE